MFLSDPGLLVRSMCLVSLTEWVSDLRLWNFTDVTLTDEDTNWILTDNDKKAFQGNVAMWLNLVANFGSDVMHQMTKFWNNLQQIRKCIFEWNTN